MGRAGIAQVVGHVTEKPGALILMLRRGNRAGQG